MYVRLLLIATLLSSGWASADVVVWVINNRTANGVDVAPGGLVLYPDKPLNRVFLLNPTPDGGTVPDGGVVVRQWPATSPDHARYTDAGTILIGDVSNRVIELDYDGGVVWAFGRDGGCRDDSVVVSGDAIRLSNGDTLISDQTQNRLLQVQRDGGLAKKYGSLTCDSGSQDHEFHDPYHIDVLENGDILVADATNDRVVRIAPSGQLLWQYGTPGDGGMDAGQLDQPLSVDGLANGNVLITDSRNNRIIEVTPEKKIAWQFGTGVRGAGAQELSRPYQAIRKDNGRTVIADRSNNRILEISPAKLTFITVAPMGRGCVGPFELGLTDFADAGITPAFDVPASLKSDSPSALFFSDTCSTKITGATVFAGGRIKTLFWLRDESGSDQTITVTAEGAEPATHRLTSVRDIKGFACAVTPGVCALLAVFLFRRRAAALLVLLLPGMGFSQSLERADAAYAANDFSAALAGYRQTLAEGNLVLEELSRAYAGIALSSAVLLENEEARKAFIRVLAITPSFVPPVEAGPKIRAPFEQAKTYWFDKPRPQIEVESTAPVGDGVEVVLRVTDPLHMMHSLRSGKQRLPAQARTRFQVQPGPFSVFALDEHGSVVAVLDEVQIAPPPPQPVAESRSDTEPTRSWLHLRAAGFAQLLSRSWGLEVGAAIGLTTFLEAGLAATLGSSPGAQLFVGLHTPGGRVRPYAQVRGDVVPLPKGAAWGGGLLLGAQLQVGPGHAFLGVVGEAFSAPPGYRALAVSISAGYALELFNAG